MRQLLETALLSLVLSTGCTSSEVDDSGDTQVEDTDTDSTPDCVGEGGTFLGTAEPHPECCAGTTPFLRPPILDTADTYEGKELPPECAPSDAPMDTIVCLACDDGTCSSFEHSCNCPADCAP